VSCPVFISSVESGVCVNAGVLMGALVGASAGIVSAGVLESLYGVVYGAAVCTLMLPKPLLPRVV
jgi:hypothetical protein